MFSGPGRVKSIPAFEPWAKVAGGRMIGHAGDVQVRAACLLSGCLFTLSDRPSCCYLSVPHTQSALFSASHGLRETEGGVPTLSHLKAPMRSVLASALSRHSCLPSKRRASLACRHPP